MPCVYWFRSTRRQLVDTGDQFVVPHASAGLHSLLYGRVSLCAVVLPFGHQRARLSPQASQPCKSHGVVASIPRSRKALKKKVAGKTRIRLKVLKWGDGEILPFWQKATKRQAKKRWYAHTYGQVSRSNSQTSYAGVAARMIESSLFMTSQTASTLSV